jgi:hypothetical protein
VTRYTDADGRACASGLFPELLRAIHLRLTLPSTEPSSHHLASNWGWFAINCHEGETICGPRVSPRLDYWMASPIGGWAACTSEAALLRETFEI